MADEKKVNVEPKPEKKVESTKSTKSSKTAKAW